ncbi:MAG: hypothetical protein SFV81_10705 [Pirellulaceae bacterium]|nr:hypothetical protein [Pirellulaceae bacterium]
MEQSATQTCCELCGRDQPLTFHHLIPCAVHRTKRFIARFGKEEMQTRGLYLCRLCHNGIHDLIPKEKDLADKYNTKDTLMAHPGILKHVNWVRKQK